jgi:precorrin-3B synthase
LWPSESHEQIRNIVASPLAGIDNTFDLSPVVHELDAALRADARVVELSGRFLFALDDGRGDVAQLTSDVLAVVDGRKAWVEGRPVALAELATTMLAIAHAFLDERSAQQSGAWHIDGLTDGRQRVRARVNAAFNGADAQQPLAPTTIRTPIGRVSQPDGRWALVVAAPLGRVTAAQACWLADQLTGRPARITPWRSVVLPDIDDIDGVEAAAHDAGLVSHRDSPWFGISACAGRPRCPKALADVQQDAAASLGRWADRRVHWSGCERHCGRPANTQVDVLATNAGYRVTETEWSGPDV